jgi:hypothetical protein
MQKVAKHADRDVEIGAEQPLIHLRDLVRDPVRGVPPDILHITNELISGTPRLPTSMPRHSRGMCHLFFANPTYRTEKEEDRATQYTTS